jgi:hypothetical protein
MVDGSLFGFATAARQEKWETVRGCVSRMRGKSILSEAAAAARFNWAANENLRNPRESQSGKNSPNSWEARVVFAVIVLGIFPKRN